MASAISNISGGEELIVSTITMSGNTSTTIDFSEYVSNYDNIRYIIWSGSGTGILCIYNHDTYLQNLAEGKENPRRLKVYGKNSSGYIMVLTNNNTDTRYYYFDDDEWNAGGEMKLYSMLDGSNSYATYARSGPGIYIVYKKEDT